MRIGIMGGTFDPIHNGHLAIAQSAADQLELSRVLFIPTGNPHFKLGQELALAEDRSCMVDIAIADYPKFELDLREIKRPGVTYTVDTLKELAQDYPNDSFFFIVGSDSATTLPTWRQAEDIAQMCTIVIAQRPKHSNEQASSLLEQGPISFDVVEIDAPQVDVSSTLVRDCVACNMDISDYVPKAVADYISKQGLYRKTQ